MENSSEDEWPFVFPQGTKIGEGRVSLVNELGPDWVIKEVNPINERGEQRSKEAIEAMKSPERVKILNKEQVILEKIFGKDHFAKHSFVLGKDKEGKEKYFMVQRRILGQTVRELIGEGGECKYKDEKEAILKNREQFREILVGVKRAVVEFGVPGDFHLGNIAEDEEVKKLVVVDFDSPTLDGEIVLAPKELFESKTPYILENVLERLERIKKYEEWLVEAGGFEVSLNVEGYDEAVKKIEEKKEEIDGWVRENKERERIEKVESFMKIVFVGEVVKQTTDEILEKARAILGEKVNEPESISLLEKIREIGAEAGDREFWMAKFLEVLR